MNPTQKTLPDGQHHSGREADSEMIGRFLNNQTKELTIREKEVALRKQSDNNSYEFAKKSLEAQAKDRESQRAHSGKILRMILLTSISALIVFLVFLFSIIYVGKESVAMEIVKGVFLVIGGGGGGYAIGRSRTLKQAQDND